MVSRRQLLAAAGGVLCARGLLDAQQAPPSQGAPTVVSNPPRDFGPNGAPTTYFADPDVLTIDPAFNALVQGNTPIRRLWTGALWTEGPAWNARGGTCCGATSRTTGSTAGSTMTDTCRCSATRRTTATATRSIRRDGSSRASTPRAVSCATSTTARSPSSPRLPGQAPQFAERRRPPQGRRDLVHRSAVRGAAV